MFPTHPVSTLCLEALILFLFNHAFFIFDEQVYQQIKGCPMGMSAMVVLANCFMSSLLTDFFLAHPDLREHLPFFQRYLDDIFGFWNGSKEELEHLILVLNQWSTKNDWQVQFELTAYGKTVDFLDITIYLNKGNWHTKPFSKETDSHAYLLPSSCHPPNVTKNIPYGTALRLRRICSETCEYIKCCALWPSTFFKNRGYNVESTTKTFNKLLRVPRASLLKKQPKKTRPISSPTITLPLTKYTAPFKAKANNLASILTSNPFTATTFPTTPRIAFQPPQNLGKLLTRTSLYPPYTNAHWMQPLLQCKMPYLLLHAHPFNLHHFHRIPTLLQNLSTPFLYI